MGVVVKVLVKKGLRFRDFLELNWSPNQTGNLHYGHLGDR